MSLSVTDIPFHRQPGITYDKGKILTVVTVTVISENGEQALKGEFIWLILRSKEH
ncbi:MAG: hypothetical protein ISR54_10450 [Chlorobium phaeobacteroides]|uniref:Uncharacterized protein n=1 Tax=Chlorobium phaeobacteroides (strain BS1) TaxID=331678 RepID=B3EPQ8_CHLPB|nr:hypothetical protein [Chlorobium phaeobacteroides]